jgi:hypothetical protein
MQLATIDVQGNRNISACFSHDARALLVAADGGVYRAFINRGDQPTFRPGIGAVSSIVSADGHLVYVTCPLEWPPISQVEMEGGTVSFLEPSRDDVSKHHPLLDLSPDGRRVAFGYVFDAIELFDVDNHQHAAWPATPVAPEPRNSDLLVSIAFSADGSHLAVVSHPRHANRPFVLRHGDADGLDAHDYPLTDRSPWVAVTPDGQHVATARRDPVGRVEMVDLATGSVIEAADVAGRVRAMAIGRDGTLTVLHTAGLTTFAIATR